MHQHKHSCVCNHSNVKYCSDCSKVYCVDCHREWGPALNWTYTQPYTWNPSPTGTNTIPATGGYVQTLQPTATLSVCSHKG